MPEQEPLSGRPERRYDETVKPSNPPNSVVRPGVRSTALWTYLGILVVTFLIVAAAFFIWAPLDRSRVADGQQELEPTSVGTSGEQMPREDTPGGFDPQPEFDSTADEIEHRGGN